MSAVPATARSTRLTSTSMNDEPTRRLPCPNCHPSRQSIDCEYGIADDAAIRKHGDRRGLSVEVELHRHGLPGRDGRSQRIRDYMKCVVWWRLVDFTHGKRGDAEHHAHDRERHQQLDERHA